MRLGAHFTTDFQGKCRRIYKKADWNIEANVYMIDTPLFLMHLVLSLLFLDIGLSGSCKRIFWYLAIIYVAHSRQRLSSLNIGRPGVIPSKLPLAYCRSLSRCTFWSRKIAPSNCRLDTIYPCIHGIFHIHYYLYWVLLRLHLKGSLLAC